MSLRPVAFPIVRTGNDLHDVPHFVPTARRYVAGENHAHPTFLQRNPVANLELGFIRPAFDRLVGCFFHQSHCGASKIDVCGECGGKHWPHGTETPGTSLCSITEQKLPALAPRTTSTRTITRGPICLRTSFTDGQRSAFNVPAVEGGSRFHGFCVVTHVNEPKPFGFSRATVSHNADSLNCSVGFKKRTENLFRDGDTQVSNKYAFHMLNVFLL